VPAAGPVPTGAMSAQESIMNRKAWKVLYRAFRRRDVNTSYTIKHHQLLISEHSGVVSQRAYGECMIDLLFNGLMKRSTYREFLIQIRRMREA
jgi:hypothetical protein